MNVFAGRIWIHGAPYCDVVSLLYEVGPPSTHGICVGGHRAGTNQGIYGRLLRHDALWSCQCPATGVPQDCATPSPMSTTILITLRALHAYLRVLSFSDTPQ